MANDNVVASAAVGVGATFRTLSDGTNEHPAFVPEYVTGGSANAWTLQAVDATHGLPTQVVAALPAGTNSIGTVILGAGSASIGTVVLGAGSAAIGSVTVSGSVAVTGTFWQATQPISAASLPLPTGAATESTLGTLNGKVTACNTGAVVISSGSLTANAGTGTYSVAGTAYQQTDAIYSGSTSLTPQFATFSVAASQTDSSIVAAVGGKKIRVLKVTIMAGSTATNATFNSKGAGAGTALSMQYQCGANGGASEAYCPLGHFQTNTGEGLTLTTGAGSTVTGQITYVTV